VSQENVVLFTKALTHNRDLAEQVRASPASVGSWAKIAYEAGFEFTPAEFASVVERALGRTLKTDAVREYLDAQAEIGLGELGQQLMDAMGGGFMATDQESTDKWARLVAKAWTDDKLRQRLTTDPKAVLKEHGLDVPSGMDVRVVENSDKVTYLTLPPKPAGDVTELTPDQLAGVSGGFCCCVVSFACTPKYISFCDDFSEYYPAPTYTQKLV
jgi:hypothetical protein